MAEIRLTASAKVPAEVAFDYVDDYRTVPGWFFGITRFDLLGTQERGVGASYDAAIRLGPKTLHSKVQVTQWEKDALITLTSYEGVKNSSSWRFRALGPEETELTVVFRYDLGSGPAGRTVTKIVEPFVEKGVEHTERNLRKQVEKHYAAQQKG